MVTAEMAHDPAMLWPCKDLQGCLLSLPRVPSLHWFGLLIAVVKRILSPLPRLYKDLHYYATTLRGPALLCYGSTKIWTRRVPHPVLIGH